MSPCSWRSRRGRDVRRLALPSWPRPYLRAARPWAGRCAVSGVGCLEVLRLTRCSCSCTVGAPITCFPRAGKSRSRLLLTLCSLCLFRFACFRGGWGAAHPRRRGVLSAPQAPVPSGAWDSTRMIFTSWNKALVELMFVVVLSLCVRRRRTRHGISSHARCASTVGSYLCQG